MLAVAGDTFSDARQITPTVFPPVETLTPERIAYVLDAGDLVSDFIDAVRAEGYKRAMSGVNIPGRKIVEAQAKRSWDDAQDPKAVALNLALISKRPMDDFLETKLVGIGEAEKLVKDAAREHAAKGKQKEAAAQAVEKMAFLTTKKSSGKLSLVPETDPRPAKSLATGTFADAVSLPQIVTGE